MCYSLLECAIAMKPQTTYLFLLHSPVHSRHPNIKHLNGFSFSKDLQQEEGEWVTAIAIKPAKPLRIIPAAIFCGNKQPFALVGLGKGFESVQQP